MMALLLPITSLQSKKSGVIKVKLETGEMVDFISNDCGAIYRGEITRVNDDIYEICVRKSNGNENCFLTTEKFILQVVDKRKTGLPEEWCAEFRYAGSPHEKHMIDVFTNGLCYVFAEWLQKHLYNSRIVYLEEEHHYVVAFGGKIYDITGDVTEKYKDCTRRKAYFHGDWVMNR